MSTVSASVTRRPLRNSALLAEPRHQVADLRPPPCTTTGRMPTRRISTMSSANSARASCSDAPAERVAAVLDDHDLAGEATDVRQRLDQRRRLLPASSSIDLAPGSRRRRRPWSGRRSRRGRARRWRPARRRRCTLGEVVDRADADHVAGALVVAGGDVRGVDPSVAFVDGEPSVTTTNGSSRYALAQAGRAATVGRHVRRSAGRSTWRGCPGSSARGAA